MAGHTVLLLCEHLAAKAAQNDEILHFVEFWQARTGHVPEELVFDSELTAFADLNRLNELGVAFFSLRRRSKKMLAAIDQVPPSARWRIELAGIARTYRTPKILDERIALIDYKGLLHQLKVTDLVHEEPTPLLTNQLKRSASRLIGRYAQLMIIENGIADGIDVFPMSALSSAAAMKIHCDPLLTLMASSLCRLLGARIRKGYERAKSQQIFRDFVDATESDFGALSNTCPQSVVPSGGFCENQCAFPWFRNRLLRIAFGLCAGVVLLKTS